MNWLEVIIVALASGVVHGVLVWYITAVLPETRLQKHMKVDTSKLSGHWEGIHLTKGDPTGGTIVSRHSYDLDFSKSGKIKGSYEECGGAQPYTFDIEGGMTTGDFFLLGKSEVTQQTSLSLLFNFRNLEKIHGFHLGYDFEGRPFASYIVLSRKRLDDEEYFAHLKKHLDNFYIQYGTL
jgi:hypothetical protein